MNRNTKKGFTIVELIIVIAVIAVLAAVLIPTFSNLINQAQQAKDTALVSDLNKGLKMSGKEFDTMHDALTAVEENVGINVAKINAVATESEILWDSVNQCFVYLKGGETTPTYIPDTKKENVQGDYDYWQIVKAPIAGNKYSQYISDKNYAIAELTVSTGFDAGYSDGIEKLIYQNESEREVTIRTNGGKLVINATNDNVNHYGAASYTNIVAVKDQSYHEHGVSAYVVVAKGHFVAEPTAKVIELNVASNDAIVSEEAGAKVVSYSKGSNVTVKVNGKDIATVRTADEVETASNTTNVVAEGGVAEISGIQFKDLQSAFDAANDNDEIKLLSDLNLTCEALLNKDVNVTLNLNGKTITSTTDLWDKDTEVYYPNIDTKQPSWSLVGVLQGCLTITGNGSLLSKDNDCYAVDVRYGAKCIIENGDFKGNIHAVYVQTGELLVKGGTFWIVQKYPTAEFGDEFVLNCYDPDYKAGTAKISVTGGTFLYFNPSNCRAEGANTNFCADGYTVVESQIPTGTENDIQYTVVKAN